MELRKVSEVFVNGVSLEKILEKHAHWLNKDCNGWEYMRAELSEMDLSGVYFENYDLSYMALEKSNLSNCVFKNCNLHEAYSECADFKDCVFKNCNLIRLHADCSNFNSAVFLNSSLNSAILCGADLGYANFVNTDFYNVYISGVNFTSTRLVGADIKNPHYDETTAFFALQCPEEGSFIGYKKVNNERGEKVIAKLQIIEDAKRSSATSRKCRCSKAKVLSITSIDGKEEYNIAYSIFKEEFKYKVGEIVEVDDFDNNRWHECSTGIHFFITRQEAVNY